MRVRRATAADADAIRALALAVQQLHVAARPDIFVDGGAETRETLLERLANPSYRFWVVEDGAAVAGYLCARVADEAAFALKHAQRVVHLDEMGVAPEHRGRGVGRLLVDALGEAARESGAARIVVNVWSFNDGAIRFYERAGFVPFAQRMALELDG